VPAPLNILRLGHLNHLTTDEEATKAHYEDLLGARFLMNIGANPMTAGYLLDVGGEIIEALIPKVLDKAEGRQLTKLGPHYSSLELYVPELAAAREAVTSRGIRLLLEGGADFLTVAADTEGVLLQVFDGDWHSDPPSPRFTAPKRPADWWRDEHPIGFRGMRHLTFVTDDLERARDFWVELCDGHELYRDKRPDANAEAVGIDIGFPVELIAPTGDGTIADFFAHFGKKIRSITYDVVDLGRTQAYFESKGITLVPGDMPGSLMLTAADNRGGIVQFVE
jgi:catechol 2,3-dioxygenase-like lactoylglutathione lyase family enzyme